MDAKIDKHGYLETKRKGDWKGQYCYRDQSRCGDFCPMFYENEKTIVLQCVKNVPIFKLEIDLRA